VTSAIYILTCLTTLLCAVLLLRAYLRVRSRLLLWSGLCFLVLSLSHLLAFVDIWIVPQTDLYTYRLASTAIAMSLLLYGLIWESQ
jgi:hypothetical protein